MKKLLPILALLSACGFFSCKDAPKIKSITEVRYSSKYILGELSKGDTTYFNYQENHPNGTPKMFCHRRWDGGIDTTFFESKPVSKSKEVKDKNKTFYYDGETDELLWVAVVKQDTLFQYSGNDLENPAYWVTPSDAFKAGRKEYVWGSDNWTHKYSDAKFNKYNHLVSAKVQDVGRRGDEDIEFLERVIEYY